jgi:hypothetical protein
MDQFMAGMEFLPARRRDQLRCILIGQPPAPVKGKYPARDLLKPPGRP